MQGRMIVAVGMIVAFADRFKFYCVKVCCGNNVGGFCKITELLNSAFLIFYKGILEFQDSLHIVKHCLICNHILRISVQLFVSLWVVADF